MLTVHHLGVSQSERIVWLCEELDLQYELKRYERRADNRMAPEDYKALHPMGVAPVITDGAVVLAESGAICDYVNVRYGQGRLAPAPSDPDFQSTSSGFTGRMGHTGRRVLPASLWRLSARVPRTFRWSKIAWNAAGP
jgi:glutathione S-transferase